MTSIGISKATGVKGSPIRQGALTRALRFGANWFHTFCDERSGTTIKKLQLVLSNYYFILDHGFGFVKNWATPFEFHTPLWKIEETCNTE